MLPQLCTSLPLFRGSLVESTGASSTGVGCLDSVLDNLTFTDPDLWRGSRSHLPLFDSNSAFEPSGLAKSMLEDSFEPIVATPMSELAFGRSSISEFALDEAPISEGGLEGSMSEVRDSSESTMRSSAWVEMADDRGLVTGGGGATLFFRNPGKIQQNSHSR